MAVLAAPGKPPLQCLCASCCCCLQDWLEVPFKSRRNIVISMVVGTSAVWFWNKSEEPGRQQQLHVRQLAAAASIHARLQQQRVHGSNEDGGKSSNVACAAHGWAAALSASSAVALLTTCCAQASQRRQPGLPKQQPGCIRYSCCTWGPTQALARMQMLCSQRCSIMQQQHSVT